MLPQQGEQEFTNNCKPMSAGKNDVTKMEQ
jgi:hypothetical protein